MECWAYINRYLRVVDTVLPCTPASGSTPQLRLLGVLAGRGQNGDVASPGSEAVRHRQLVQFPGYWWKAPLDHRVRQVRTLYLWLVFFSCFFLAEHF